MHNAWRVSLLAASVMVFAACSESGGESDKAAGNLINGIAEISVSTIPDIYDAAHTPASGVFEGALLDISDHTCAQVADGWRVTGTATNPTGSSVDYRIYISLLNGVSTTRALVETQVLNVASGGAGDFDTVIAMPDDDLRCVLRVERHSQGV